MKPSATSMNADGKMLKSASAAMTVIIEANVDNRQTISTTKEDVD